MKKTANRLSALYYTSSLLIALLMFSAYNAAAADCSEHALLRHASSDTQYKWSNKEPFIRVWESPDMIRVVGTVRMGTDVEVVSRARGFIRIGSEEGKAGSGWVSERQVEQFIHPGPDALECAEADAGGAATFAPTY